MGGTPSEQRVFVYEDGQVVLQFDKSASGNLATADLNHRYLWGPAVDQLLADEDVNSLTSPGTVLWPLTDHLGTVRDWINSAGTVLDHVEYDSFGRRVDTTVAVDAAFGWKGRYRDPLTGLQYNNARWYNPAIGRWMSEDPIGFAAGDANLSRYVENQPTSYVDPDGLEAEQAGSAQNQTVPRRKRTHAHDLMDEMNREPGLYQRQSEFAADVGPDLEAAGEAIAETNPISGTLLSECRIFFGYDPLTDQQLNEWQRTNEALWTFGTLAIGAIIHKFRMGGNLLSPEEAAGLAARLRSLPLVDQLGRPIEEQRFLLNYALGKHVGSGKIAHHIIPLEAITRFQSLLERAARGGFDINGCNNGIAVAEHFAGHPKYNAAVLAKLRQIEQQAHDLSDREIAQQLQKLADQLREAIDNGSYGPWE